MNKQHILRKLSETKTPDAIAYCQACDEYFIDDVPGDGPFNCPNAKCQHKLMRGLMKTPKGIVNSNGGAFIT